MIRSIRLGSAGLAMVVLFVACRGSSPAATTVPGRLTVKLRDPELVFAPVRVVVHAGETVTWQWPGGAAHNVTFPDFTSGTYTEGTFQHTFRVAGTFRYQCTLHTADGKGMIGQVVVLS